MTKFNVKKVSKIKETKTFENGKGLSQSPTHELIGLLSTGIQSSFYEKENERIKRFEYIFNKVASVNKEFAAKALIYARTVFGQRTITHIGSIEIIKYLSGDKLGKKFFSKRDRKENKGGIVYRLDDMAEILACYQAKNGTNAPIPNAIRKGFKDAIEAADAYTLAKYQMKGHGISLVDIVNLVRPTETKYNGTVDINKDEYLKAIDGVKRKKDYINAYVREKSNIVTIPSLHALMYGMLKQFNTVEDKNTEAGQDVSKLVKSGEISKEQAKEILNEKKVENYVELIETKKIGYLALLRNLRNMVKTSDAKVLDKACALLVDEKFIKKSLVWPHQIDLTLEIMLSEFKPSQLGRIVIALNEAYEKSIPNLTELFPKGKTAVVFDSSGSMSTPISLSENKRGIASAKEKACLVAATFAKGVYGDVYTFANSCHEISYNPTDSINTLKNHYAKSCHAGGGTSWDVIFTTLNKKYDRIIIISDEQSSDSALRGYKEYSDKFGNPYVYIINICGYANTTDLKTSNRIFRLHGYNEELYNLACKVEINCNVVIEEINKINI